MLAACAMLGLRAMPALAASCGLGQSACTTPMGSYHIALPDTPPPTGGYPFVMFLHGAGGTSDGIMKMRRMTAAFTRRGYAVIAPQGLSWRGGKGGMWAFLPGLKREKMRDEAAFFEEVQADAVARYDVTQAKGLLSGFSAGAFMVSYLACDRPNAFFAYAPVSGGFWRPHPAACAGPVRLFQTHGWDDKTVPLEGRPLGTRFLQGDILEGLSLWRATNGCSDPAPDGYDKTDQFLRRRWACAPGSSLEFALFPGGHQVPSGWAAMVIDWAEALPRTE